MAGDISDAEYKEIRENAERMTISMRGCKPIEDPVRFSIFVFIGLAVGLPIYFALVSIASSLFDFPFLKDAADTEEISAISALVFSLLTYGWLVFRERRWLKTYDHFFQEEKARLSQRASK